MPEALFLSTDGKFELVNLKEIEDYNEKVDGYIQSVPISHDYLNEDNKKRERLCCYVNEEGLINDLPINPWCAVLACLGVKIDWYYGGLRGNIILFTERKGDDGKISSYIVNVIKEFKKCDDGDNEDEDLNDIDKFLVDLEKKHKPKKEKLGVSEEKEIKSNKSKRYDNDEDQNVEHNVNVKKIKRI